MTRNEKIALVVGFLALGVLIIIEVKRAHDSIMAAQGTFGGPQSTNANPPGQQFGPDNGEAAIAANVGPWYLYYNTPGSYALGPPLVNVMAPPATVSSATTDAPGGCSSCQ